MGTGITGIFSGKNPIQDKVQKGEGLLRPIVFSKGERGKNNVGTGVNLTITP